MDQTQWITSKEAARTIGVDVRQVQRWAKNGLIPGAVAVGPRGVLRLPSNAADYLVRPASVTRSTDAT